MEKVQQRKQKGFTLIELGIVLALIGIGLFFAISKINETSDQSRAQNVSNELSSTITGIKRYYATQPAFPQNMVLIDMARNGVFPNTWVTPGANPVVNPPFGGGALTLGVVPGDANSAQISIPNVPPRICSELGRLMANGSTAIGVGQAPPVAPNVKLPNGQLTLNTLGTTCNPAGGAAVVMTFRFTRG
jgi:prepilin-type N-terminal cleavage/methylation domain-containing protein